MNKQVKTAWVEALRSGEYEQGRGSLAQGYVTETPTSFCCLGVLTALYLKEAKLNWNRRGSRAVLGTAVQAWADLGDDPSVRFDGSFTTLGSLNDGIGMDGPPLTFDQIADVIEGEL